MQSSSPEPNQYPSQEEGRFILFTGLSGSGKSTLAGLLHHHLNESGPRPVTLLDGDVVRQFFEGDYGYSEAERHEVSKRMAFAAYTMVRNGFDVIMANIAARSQTREFFRKKFRHSIEIFLDAPIDKLRTNDPKGLYSQADKLDQPMVVGIDLPYDRPQNPDLTLNTHQEPISESFAKLLAMLETVKLGTKGQTLRALSSRLKKSKIPPLVILSGNDYKPSNLTQQLTQQLGHTNVAVRSSASCEDRAGSSNAGVFKSVLDVPCTDAAIQSAISQVRKSYKKAYLDPNQEEILIQAQLSQVALSGVIFSRHIYANSPYRAISYDRTTGRTDTVTSGRRTETIFLDRFQEPGAFPRWRSLLEAVIELENFFPDTPLDIEFAVDHSGGIFILQCRPLACRPSTGANPSSVKQGMDEARARLTRLQRRRPHLMGSTTVLSNMADWNPAEIIGEKPSTLAYSLYRDLVCDETWHQARSSQGYRNVSPAPLLASICRRGFMDTRALFNSFIPADLPLEIADKLVTSYLNQLIDQPHLHDKVEFEVAQTAYSLQLKETAGANGLNQKETALFIDCLRNQTNHLVNTGCDAIIGDLKQISLLDQKRLQISSAANQPNWWDRFESADLLLRYTRQEGVLPFARIARLAFIAKKLLRSLEKAGLISTRFIPSFEANLHSPASALNQKMIALGKGDLSVADFFQQFGHLRMKTYDIESPRYDQIPIQHWQTPPKSCLGPKAESQPALPKSVDIALREHRLNFNGKQLLDFAKAALEGREWAKFHFTRSLSDALEQIASGTEQLGLSRGDTQFLTLASIRKLANPEDTNPISAKRFLEKRIAEKRRERAVHDLIMLPPVIVDTNDISQVGFFESQPNYITNKRVRGVVVHLNRVDPIECNLNDKIVVIENADPGYDWIFTRGVAGLITKYGGAASHMAIRCGELNLPGAIGCGELIFQRIQSALTVDLDCDSRVIQTSRTMNDFPTPTA